MDELNIECEFDDGAIVLGSSDKEICVSDKEPLKVKNIINKANTDRYMKDVQNQLWVRVFVTQHCNHPQIRHLLTVEEHSRHCNVNRNKYQTTTPEYQDLQIQKLHKGVEELSCRLCTEKQETVSHVLCGCSHIAWSLYKTRHDKMLRPVSHALLEKYGFNESDYPSPWYMQSHPQPSKKKNVAKILWDIPWQLEKCPKNGANKPDISILDRKNEEWCLV